MSFNWENSVFPAHPVTWVKKSGGGLGEVEGQIAGDSLWSFLFDTKIQLLNKFFFGKNTAIDPEL